VVVSGQNYRVRIGQTRYLVAAGRWALDRPGLWVLPQERAPAGDPGEL